ncbi:MAG TPA: hypothetical protein VLA34_07765, partial [Candidatus Krumholzibacterium sp.]|nr:hypothetical protein [Candidatus Krumholzibacterium sp.]
TEPSGTRSDRRKRLVPTFATLVLLLVSFAMGEYLVPRVMPPGWKSGAGAVSAAAVGSDALSSDPEVLRIRALRTTIRQGLEEYYATRGSYPFTLEVLAVRKFIPASAVQLAQQSGIHYRMGENGSGYLLD